MTLRYRDYLRVWETGYGRSDGWDVEQDGRAIAFLDEPRFEDMFWISYRLTPTAADVALRERLLTEAFWKGDPSSDLVFRSRATGLVAEHAFPAGQPFVAPARLNMRALYIAVRHPLPWDWIVLSVRRLMRRSRRVS